MKKHILDVEQDLWDEVLKYKIDKHLNNNNDAVVELIKEGLSITKGKGTAIIKVSSKKEKE